MENIKGGSVELRLRNCIAGPQGTSNYFDVRQPRGWPKKDVCKSLTNLQDEHQVILPESEPEPVVTEMKIDVPTESTHIPMEQIFIHMKLSNVQINHIDEPIKPVTELLKKFLGGRFLIPHFKSWRRNSNLYSNNLNS